MTIEEMLKELTDIKREHSEEGYHLSLEVTWHEAIAGRLESVIELLKEIRRIAAKEGDW